MIDGISVDFGIMQKTRKGYVFADQKLIIGFGIKDLVIVDAGDVILIIDKNKDQEVKHLTEIKQHDGLNRYL